MTIPTPAISAPAWLQISIKPFVACPFAKKSSMISTLSSASGPVFGDCDFVCYILLYRNRQWLNTDCLSSSDSFAFLVKNNFHSQRQTCEYRRHDAGCLHRLGDFFVGKIPCKFISHLLHQYRVDLDGSRNCPPSTRCPPTQCHPICAFKQFHKILPVIPFVFIYQLLRSS